MKSLLIGSSEGKIPSSVIRKTILKAYFSDGIGTSYNYKLAASIFDRKGKIYACRTNTYKTHPIMVKYAGELKPHLHAEINAAIAAGLDDLEGLNILVLRLTNTGSLTMAQPCPSCLKLLRDKGIARIYFSNWDGEIEEDNRLRYRD